MILLVLINGKKDKIIEAHGIDPENIEVQKLDEKMLSKPGYMVGLLNRKKYEKVLFGCMDLLFQRFQSFMKLYIFFSKIKKGAVADELSQSNEYSFARLAFVEFPMLVIEAVVSIIVAMYYYIKLPILKWRLIKKN